MQCPKCNSAVAADANYCAGCGEKLFARDVPGVTSAAPPPHVGPAPPQITEPTQPEHEAQAKVGGNWGRKLLITILGLGSAVAYYFATPNDSDSIFGHAISSLAYGFAAFVITYLVSWIIMSIRRKPMHGFFHRHPVVFLLPMVLIAVASGFQLARAQQGGANTPERRSQQLQREIEALQASLPTQIADGISLTSIVNGGTYVTFGFSLDANMIDAETFSQGIQDDFRASSCSDPKAMKFLRHYEIPIALTFRIGAHAPITVHVAPSDCP